MHQQMDSTVTTQPLSETTTPQLITVDVNTINQLVNDVTNLRSALEKNSDHTESLQEELVSLRAKVKQLTEEKEKEKQPEQSHVMELSMHITTSTTTNEGDDNDIVALDTSQSVDSSTNTATTTTTLLNRSTVTDRTPSLPMVLQCSLHYHYHIPIELRLMISRYYCEEIADSNIYEAVKLSMKKETANVAKLRYGHLSSWDTSRVTMMHFLFSLPSIGTSKKSIIPFNINLNDWDVSNVVKMSGMFANCSSFNQPLNKWNTSNVTCITCMFSGCSEFNQPLDQWNVSNCQLMGNTFCNASSFNQPLNTWNVQQVKLMDSMFEGAIAFNQPLDQWNIQQVKTMKCMFKYAFKFNQSLNSWRINPDIVDVQNMFQLAKQFNKNHISEWPNVTMENTPLGHPPKSALDAFAQASDEAKLQALLSKQEERELKAAILFTGYGIQFTKLHLRQLKWVFFWIFMSFLFVVSFILVEKEETQGLCTLIVVVGTVLYTKSFIASLRYVPEA